MVFSISRRKGAGRISQKRWPTKIDGNGDKHGCCCCQFGQELPSNCIKNYSRIYEHPQDCSSSDSERGFGKEKVVCTFCSTLLDTWSSHIFPRHYRDGRWRQKFFLTKLLREIKPGVLLMTPKQSDRVLNGLVRHPLGRKKTDIPKVPHQNHVDYFFRLSRRSAQRIRTRGKNSKCRIC